MPMILPSARLGLARTFGLLRTPEGRPGIEVKTIDNKVVVDIWRHTKTPSGGIHSEKFYTIELPAASAEQFAAAERT
jgi:hypothetical protein